MAVLTVYSHQKSCGWDIVTKKSIKYYHNFIDDTSKEVEKDVAIMV